MSKTSKTIGWVSAIGVIASLVAIASWAGVTPKDVLGVLVWIGGAILAVLTFGVPVWLLIGLFAVWRLAKRLRRGSTWQEETSDTPSWNAYTSDRFFEVDWVWQWKNGDELSQVQALCPVCQNELDEQDLYPPQRRGAAAILVPSIPIATALRCSHCGRSKQVNVNPVEDEVKKAVRRRLRTGGWKGADDRLTQPVDEADAPT